MMAFFFNWQLHNKRCQEFSGKLYKKSSKPRGKGRLS